MRLNQVFDDLSDFVATYHGRISRDGILLHTDTLYEEGTVLGVEITLTESLPLIRGTAGVVQLMKGTEETGKPYSVVLEFLQLDEDSEAFLDRLTERFESEGVEAFHLDQVVEKGRRGIRRQSGSFRVVDMGADPAAAGEADFGAKVVQAESDDGDESTPGTRRSLRPWLLAALGIAVIAAAATVVPLPVDPIEWVTQAVKPGETGGTRGTSIDSDNRVPVDTPAGSTVVGDDSIPDYPENPPPDIDLSSLPPATRIESVKWHEAGDFTVVTVIADGRIDETSIKHFRMNEAPQSKMVLYLYGVGPGDLEYKTQIDGNQLASIRVWYHEEKSPVQLHIVLDLASLEVVAFKPVVEGHRLVVTLGPRE